MHLGLHAPTQEGSKFVEPGRQLQGQKNVSAAMQPHPPSDPPSDPPTLRPTHTYKHPTACSALGVVRALQLLGTDL